MVYGIHPLVHLDLQTVDLAYGVKNQSTRLINRSKARIVLEALHQIVHRFFLTGCGAHRARRLQRVAWIVCNVSPLVETWQEVKTFHRGRDR
jgi:hypothetical protein